MFKTLLFMRMAALYNYNSDNFNVHHLLIALLFVSMLRGITNVHCMSNLGCVCKHFNST